MKSVKPANLTFFQSNLRDRLRLLLIENDLVVLAETVKEFYDSKYSACAENHIEVEIEDLDLKVWVYEDGAMFVYGNLEKRYESPDFESLLEMTEKIIQDLYAVINKYREGKL